MNDKQGKSNVYTYHDFESFDHSPLCKVCGKLKIHFLHAEIFALVTEDD